MENTAPRGPLTGIRVIEAGSLIAGPFSGQLLGDLGAEVIKVEAPVTGDAFRAWGRHTDEGAGVWWATQSRNKQSVTINLRTEEGQSVFRDLLAEADVLIENFRPGTLAKWGLGEEALSEQFPRLVVSHVSGFGQTGPYAGRAGYASIGEAMGGLRYITGYEDRPPTRIGISLGDSLAAVFSTIGVLAALNERHRSGQGQHIDTSIYESVLALTESMVADAHVFGIDRERTGTTLKGIAPSNAYPTGDGKSIIIAANQDTVFKRLCAAMDMPELVTDPRFVTHQARGDNMDEIDAIIAEWSQKHAADDLLNLLEDAGVPAGNINRASDILSDPHIEERGSITWADAPGIGRLPMPNVTPRLSRTPGGIQTTGPRLGEHTITVLRDLLHYDESRVQELSHNGHI